MKLTIRHRSLGLHSTLQQQQQEKKSLPRPGGTQERGLAAGDCQRLAAALSTFTAAASVQDICYCFFGQQPLQFYMASNYSHSPRSLSAVFVSLPSLYLPPASPHTSSPTISRHLFHFILSSAFNAVASKKLLKLI